MAGSKAGWARWLVWRRENHGKNRYRVFQDEDGWWFIASPSSLLYSYRTWKAVMAKINDLEESA